MSPRRRSTEPPPAATASDPGGAPREAVPSPSEAPATGGASPEDSRARLIAAARRVFAERGFHGTTADHLIDAAGLTRGALYRDFADKRDLFRAVFIAVEEDLGQAIAAGVGSAKTTGEMRRAAMRAFLRGCLDPEVRRIVILEGPVVLGWEEFREIDGRYSLAFVSLLLEAEMAAGLRPRQPVRPLAHLVVGAMNEAGLAVASSRDPEAAIEEFANAVDSLWGTVDGGGRAG